LRHGPQFHWDYYNSFVIQPMLLEVIDAVSNSGLARAHRLRRMGSPLTAV
jgi:hypothetical protein